MKIREYVFNYYTLNLIIKVKTRSGSCFIIMWIFVFEFYCKSNLFNIIIIKTNNRIL